MAVSPIDGEEKIINDIRRTYAEAERAVIEKIASYVQGGKMDLPNWEERKLALLRDLNQEVREEVVQDVLGGAKEDVREAIDEAYKDGAKDSAQALIKAKGADQVPVTGDLTEVDQESVKALSRGITDRLNNVDIRVLRTAEDKYREVIANASRQGITGAVNRRQVAQQALNEFANRGVTGFVDSNDRRWNLSSYTEMATRSTMGRAQINGSMNRAQQNDHDLMIVGTSYEPCEVCMPWEGRILSVSGESDQYPSVQEAEDAGLWHPNCTHSISPYIPGVTEKPEIEEEKKHERYKERQQQRYNERQIRKWKRRKSAAITEEDKQYAQSKITEWQKEQKDFIERTDRYRKYEREQIGQAR